MRPHFRGLGIKDEHCDGSMMFQSLLREVQHKRSLSKQRVNEILDPRALET